MRLFLDSSALMKSYLPEPGTDRVLALCAEAQEVIVSVLAVPEGISTLNRVRRQKLISDEDYDALKTTLMNDVGNSTVVPLSPSIVTQAVMCLERAPLRGCDAVHVAAALETAPELFVTGDRRQSSAARELGLKVETVGFDDEAPG